MAGVDIPNQKRIEFSLQYIFGIGPTTAKSILADTVRFQPDPAIQAPATLLSLERHSPLTLRFTGLR